MGISIPQLLIILLIVALLFGTKKLRNIGGDLGSALKGFKNAMTDDKDDKDGGASAANTSAEGEADADNIIEGEIQKSEKAAEQKEEQV